MTTLATPHQLTQLYVDFNTKIPVNNYINRGYGINRVETNLSLSVFVDLTKTRRFMLQTFCHVRAGLINGKMFFVAQICK